MTNTNLDSLLQLDAEEAQRQWLQQFAPAKDDSLLQAVEVEAQRRWRTNPHTAFPLARIISLAAAIWADQEVVATGLHMEANTHWFLSDHRVALALYRAARNLYDSLGLDLKAARVAVGQLNAMMYLGMYDEGLQLADQAGAVFRQHTDDLALSKIVMNRGNILFRLGRYQEALTSYQEAQTIFTSLADHHHAAMARVNAASVYMTLDAFAQAEQLLQQARLIFATEAMQGMLALVDHNLAELSFYQGQYQQALQIFNQARQTFVAQDSHVDVAYVDLYRSDVYLALNLWAEALNLAQSARRPFQEAEMNWEMGRLWLNEAAALAHLANGRTPEPALAQARLHFDEDGNHFWLAFTDLYEATFAWRQGEVTLARQRAQAAMTPFREAGLHSRLAQCHIVLGESALLENNQEEAAAWFTQALAMLETADLPAITYVCHYGLGRIAQMRGGLDEARLYYRQSIGAIERLQAAIGAEDYKIAFLSDKLRVYEAHILLCLQSGGETDLQEAFATVEQAKSRALLDLLAREVKTAVASEAEAAFVAELERLKRELNWYYNRLHGGQADSRERSVQQMRALTTAVARREQALSQLLHRWRSPDLAAASPNVIWTISLAQIQAVLAPQTMLLEFYATNACILVFGITADAVWSQELPIADSTIADALGQLRFQMNKFGYGAAYSERHAHTLRQSVDDILRLLYELLIAPIAGRLTADTLIIVPHGVLHYVPFHALYDGQAYLLENKVISYSPSATILYRLLLLANGRTYTAPVIVGLADKAIPHAQTEAQAIASLFSGARLRLGSQATLDAIRADLSHAAFWHLSTHATFRSDNPLFSALKLADGWLSVNDLYAFSQLPPLVTLSACETGRYQVAVGDELMGLCRGLLAAGARSVVVSLWMAEDESTAQLMTRFYGSLQQGAPLNHALRDAQLYMMNQKPHPYYWASFVLIGGTHNPLTQHHL